jgi:carbonic anhydrase
MCDKHQPVNPAKAIADIFANNAEYCKTTPQKHFDAVQKGQWPWVGIIDCADSRVTINSVVGSQGRMGQAFNYTCAGTLVDAGRGSIEYAVDHLGVKLLLVEGHTECGMVKAALSDTSAERSALHQDARAVKARIDGVGKDNELGHLDDLTQAIIRNTFAQAWEVQSWFRKEITNGDVAIVSSLYDLHNKIGNGFGKQYIYSINGETDKTELLKHSIMQQLTPDEREEMLIK